MPPWAAHNWELGSFVLKKPHGVLENQHGVLENQHKGLLALQMPQLAMVGISNSENAALAAGDLFRENQVSGVK
jgi:hypothetical protein